MKSLENQIILMNATTFVKFIFGNPRRRSYEGVSERCISVVYTLKVSNRNCTLPTRAEKVLTL
jgi:hypothetical protein